MRSKILRGIDLVLSSFPDEIVFKGGERYFDKGLPPVSHIDPTIPYDIPSRFKKKNLQQERRKRPADG